MISIVIPVYNAERFLRQTIESILNQRFKDFELILVDDGSGDGSLAIIQEYKDDPRVTILSGENRGAPAARNWGASIAKGEYILFFDADDYLYDEALNKINAMTSQNDDLIIWNYDYVNEEGIKSHSFDAMLKLADHYDVSSFENMKIMMHLPPLTDNKLYKSEIIRKYNIVFDKLNIAQDLNFYCKYLSVCKTVHICIEPLCAYRVVRGSISHSFSLKKFDIVKSFEYIDDFCDNNMRSKEFKDELWNLRVEHYKRHYMSYLRMSNYKMRIATFTFFSHQFQQIKDDHLDCLSMESISFVNRALRKWKYRFIYLNPLYPVFVRWVNTR